MTRTALEAGSVGIGAADEPMKSPQPNPVGPNDRPERDTGGLCECPFCGERGVETFIDEGQGFKWGYAACGCGARGPEVRTQYNEALDAPWRADARAEWNRRPEASSTIRAQAAELERLRGALRTAAVELDMAQGGLTLLPSDFEQMEEAWPVSKRGARAWRHYGHARERLEAILACVRDAAHALKTEGTSNDR